ncbi:hypothetical protein CJJ07_001301 [Candidozyma auris]|nr:hypothetical protein CJJ07_001301 [[Candida] auris]QEL58892.1 hypothetical protein CJJ09_000948 [[Candida] auris]
MGYLGSTFFSLAVSNEPNNIKLDAVLELKTHVKKENVDLSQVQAYFEAISILMDSRDQTLQSTTFSLLCHLVKRVSIQDSRSTVLQDHGFLILPIIISRIADARASVKISARRALEAYWLTAPSKVEQALIESGMKSNSALLTNECVVWLNTVLTEVNRHFSLNPFMSTLAEILVQHEQNALLVENIKILFANYYDLKQNRLHKFELQKILEFHGVPAAIRTSIMGTNQVLKSREKSAMSHEVSGNNVSASRLEKPKNTDTATIPSESIKLGKDEKTPSNSPVDDIIAGLQNYNLEKKIQPSSCQDKDALYTQLAGMIPTFEGKETESNWIKREAHITSLRSIVRGNAHIDFPDDLAHGLKDIAEGICKGLLSLRTTLSVSACQLVKETAILLKDHFDPLVDSFAPTLIKLNSATKHMTSSNAHIAMCAIMINCTYSSKLLHKIQTASSEKGSNSRSHSSIWIKIFISRSSNSGKLPHTEVIERVLGRLLSDSISTVRQNAKEAFWCLQATCPESAERLLTRLDANVVKSLERSNPAKISKLRPDIAQTKPARSSIKDSIIAKNRELNSRRAGSRSNSRNAIQRSNEIEQKRGQYRVQSDPPSSDRRYGTALPKSLETKQFSGLTKHRSLMDLSVKPNADLPKLRPVSSTTFSTVHSANRPSTSITPNIKTDPIFQFLASSNEATISEGVNLLRYAILVEERFPDDIKFYLRKVSFTHPECLRPLLDQPDVLAKARFIMAPEDILRVCFIIFPDSEEAYRNISSSGPSDLYQSVGTILSYIANFDSIVGEKLLAMQTIKFKNRILESAVQFLLHCMSIVQVDESSFPLLVKPLFDLVAIFHSLPTYNAFKTLILRLFETNKSAFQENLPNLSESSRRELESIVGINQQCGSDTMSSNSDDTNDVKNVPKGDLGHVNKLHADNSMSDSNASQHESNKADQLDNEGELKNSSAQCERDLEDVNGGNESTHDTNGARSDSSNKEFNLVKEGRRPIPSADVAERIRDPSVEANNAACYDFDANQGENALDAVEPYTPSFNQEKTPRSEIGTGECTAQELAIKDVNEHGNISSSFDNNSPEFVAVAGNSMDESGSNIPKDKPKKLPELNSPQKEVSHGRARSVTPEIGNVDLKSIKVIHSERHAGQMNVFATNSNTPMRNEFFNKLNSDPSVELVNDFAQVKITNRLNSIQSFLDKVDPLSKISSKARPISIFEDTKASGSPQKVKDYSYTELNWFNFSVARLALDGETESFDDYNIVEFNDLCKKLQSSITGKEFVCLLRYLQNEQSMEFDSYFVQEGLYRIEDALHLHLWSNQVKDKLSGLIILKQLLINRDNVNFGKTWKTLVHLSDEVNHEVDVAISETFDETLCGMFASSDMIQCIIKTITEQKTNLSDHALNFVFQSLLKLVAQKTMVLSITDELLRQLHEILKCYLTHRKVEIRKNVVQTYGKLVRAARVSELTDNNYNNRQPSTTKEACFVEELLDSMTRPQRKMVEYYSH